MIAIEVFHSGSTGNLYRLKSDCKSGSILLEAGIRFDKLSRCIDFDFANIAGCLISHEHQDHARSVEALAKRGVNLYMSEGTRSKLGDLNFMEHLIKADVSFKVGGWLILPLAMQHDAVEPLGFVITDGEDNVLFATDTYYIKYRFKGLTYLMVECNYIKEDIMARIDAGYIPKPLAKRLFKSHMNLENLLSWLKMVDLSTVKKIYCIHISGDNGNPETIKKAVEAATGIPVETCRC